MKHPTTSHSYATNEILIKGIVLGLLILLMLIPAAYVNNLVKERETRQQQVVKEVSSKWAAAQTFSGPYLVIPYSLALGNKPAVTKNLILLPSDLKVTGNMLPEGRALDLPGTVVSRQPSVFRRVQVNPAA